MGTDDGSIDDLLHRYRGQQGALIPLLQQIQERHGYLRACCMEDVARALKLLPSQVYGVASFYSQFRLVPPGKTRVKVCRGTACHVRGSARILQELETLLNCRAGSTSEDFKYSLERIACFGACGLAPVLVVDDEVYGRQSVEKSKRLLLALEKARNQQ